MEIADALGYPQSSTSALLRSLVGMGYLNYDAHARTYITSSRVALLGSWVNSQFRSEEHTSELQSLMRISYAVFCLKKKNNQTLSYLYHQPNNAGFRVAEAHSTEPL